MVEYLIEESGFPKDRPTLKKFHDSFKKPITEFLRLLPGNRVLSGYEVTDNGDGTITTTEGLVVFENKIYTLAAYTGVPQTKISFFETTNQGLFNVGTQDNPVYENRDFEIERTAQLGDVVGNDETAFISSFNRDRQLLEYIKSGTAVIGLVVITTTAIVYEITFPEIPTNDYIVIGNFRPLDPADSLNESFDWVAKDKTTTGFKVVVSNVTSDTNTLRFDWSLVVMNRLASYSTQI